MLVGIQFVGLIFALVMIYLTFVYYKRKNYDWQSALLWIIVWLGVGVIIVFPQTIYGLMQALEIERTADFFVMSGFALFSVIIFYLYGTVKRTNKRMNELVRALAYEKTQNNNNSKTKTHLNTSKHKKIKR